MFRGALFLLACSIALSFVAALSNDIVLPARVKSLHEQCRRRGHLGECWEMNILGLTPHCGRVMCAGRHSRGDKKVAVRIGNTANGLKCGAHKVCWNGSCIELPDGTSMPIQSRNTGAILYDCYVPGSAGISN